MSEASRLALQNSIKQSESRLRFARSCRADDLVYQHEVNLRIQQKDAEIAELESGIAQMKADLT